MSSYNLSSQALKDLREIVAFKEQYDLQTALQWLDRARQKFDTLAKFPGMGKKRDELSPGLRSFPIDRHLIFYRDRGEQIEIVRVVSGYQDLEALFEEDTDPEA